MSWKCRKGGYKTACHGGVGGGGGEGEVLYGCSPSRVSSSEGDRRQATGTISPQGKLT